MVFLCMICMADDEGRIEGNHETVAHFGGWGDLSADLDESSRGFSIDSRRVANALADLYETGRIIIYEVEGNSYIQIVNWRKHQKIDHVTPSIKPPPPAPPAKSREHSSKPREHSPNSREVSRNVAPDLDLDLGGSQCSKDISHESNSHDSNFIDSIASDSVREFASSVPSRSDATTGRAARDVIAQNRNSLDVVMARQGKVLVLRPAGEAAGALNGGESHHGSSPSLKTIQ
jgi:hypothetical protein